MSSGANLSSLRPSPRILTGVHAGNAEETTWARAWNLFNKPITPMYRFYTLQKGVMTTRLSGRQNWM